MTQLTLEMLDSAFATLQKNQQELLEKEDYLRKLEDTLNLNKTNHEILQTDFENQQARLVELILHLVLIFHNDSYECDIIAKLQTHLLV